MTFPGHPQQFPSMYLLESSIQLLPVWGKLLRGLCSFPETPPRPAPALRGTVNQDHLGPGYVSQVSQGLRFMKLGASSGKQ